MQRRARRVVCNSDQQQEFKTCQGSSCQNMPAASPIKLCKRIASDCIQCMCMSASLILGPWLLVLGSWSLALGKYVHHLSEIRYSQYLLWIIGMMNIDLHYNCFWLWVFLSLGIFGCWCIYIYIYIYVFGSIDIGSWLLHGFSWFLALGAWLQTCRAKLRFAGCRKVGMPLIAWARAWGGHPIYIEAKVAGGGTISVPCCVF